MSNNVNKKIAIGIVTKYFYPVQGGIEASILNIHKYFDPNHYLITIYTTKPSEELLNQSSPAPKVFNVLRSKFFEAPSIFRIFKNDIVVLENFNILPHGLILLTASILKMLNKKTFKLILVPHGGITPNWQKFSFATGIIKKVYTNYLGLSFIKYCCDHVITVSEWEYLQLQQLGIANNKLSVIPNPTENVAFENLKTVEPEFIKLVEKFGDYIIQVGKVYPTKRYELSINALAKTANISLVILGLGGNESYIKTLEQLIKQSNLKARVFFITYPIKPSEKYYLLANAKMQLHVAEWENFGSVIYEGMSQKLVQVVTNNGNLPYLVKNNVNGYVVDSNDNQIAEKIMYILQNQNSSEITMIKETNKAISDETQENFIFTKVSNLYSKVKESENE